MNIDDRGMGDPGKIVQVAVAIVDYRTQLYVLTESGELWRPQGGTPTSEPINWQLIEGPTVKDRRTS